MDGLHLNTSIRDNRMNTLMELTDKIPLRKRSVIKTVNDKLKNINQIEYTRHRSFENFQTNLIFSSVAYASFPKKTAIKYDPVETNQLSVF
ncbi:MAG: transposase [Cyclobacteriaceae bacterium]